MLVELGLVEQRYAAVREVLDDAATVTDVARRYGVARQTVHTWLRRYAAQGLAGWLATLDGNYWSRRRVALAPVQMLGDGATLDWPAAITAFEAVRQHALRPR